MDTRLLTWDLWLEDRLGTHLLADTDNLATGTLQVDLRMCNSYHWGFLTSRQWLGILRLHTLLPLGSQCLVVDNQLVLGSQSLPDKRILEEGIRKLVGIQVLEMEDSGVLEDSHQW